MIYAEVIGDPIEQSKSPIIHRYWLAQLGIEGDYLRTRVPSGRLSDFLTSRRSDPKWRGCNVTIPHKERIIALLAELDPRARAIGAVNCVTPSPTGLRGANTDVDGIAAALDGTEIGGRKAALIGAGGGARAAASYLTGRGVTRLTILARDPVKAEPLRELAYGAEAEILPLEMANQAFEGTAAIVNASPLGMAGCVEMSDDLLAAVRRNAAKITIFDMVYKPLDTAFLKAGREGGGKTVDGLTMLVGQAARAFELFYGQAAPPPDEQLRALLTM